MKQPRTAREIMLTRLVTLAPEEPVFPCIAKLLDLGITGAPVVEQRCRYLGVFAERSAMQFLIEAGHCANSLDHSPSAEVLARDIMSRESLSLAPDADAFEAVTRLLAEGVSGAPVLDPTGRYLGLFSEKTGMALLRAAVYDQLPSCRVDAFMDTDRTRLIEEDLGVVAIIEKFLDTHFRRLPVIRDGRLVGQITRRDVLKACMEKTKASREAWDRVLGQGVRVGDVMDSTAWTIEPKLDLLSIAGIFQTTPYRRLPVLEQEDLAGLVRRKDTMKALNCIVRGIPQLSRRLRYLSGL